MKRLQEIRSLVDLARKFGQEPAAELLQQLQQLEIAEQRRLDREAQIRERIAADITEMFAPVVHEAAPTSAVTVLTEAQIEPLLEVQVPQTSVDAVRDYIARNVKESIVAPDPVLAVPQKDLEREIRYLREWVGKIAATGPGSGEVNLRYLDDVDRSTINQDWYLTYDPTSKKFIFKDISTTTRVSIEAFDRTTSIALSTTPQLLIPNSFTNAKNMTYNTSTGVFTFLTQCEVTLALTINALSTAANQRVFQYAERNSGTGWVPIANSGKIFQLVNGQLTQIVNAQTISRQAGEQIRYYIHATDTDKVSLITETIPGVTGNTVYVPAIRIQYAGR
jgi:hypothetical protein